MNRILVIALTIVLSLSLYSCNKKDNLNSELIEKVKIIEENDFKFRKFELTYEDYKKNTIDIFSYTCNYLDKTFAYLYKKPIINENPNPYKISVEDMNDYRIGYNDFYMNWFGIIPAEENVIIKISDVYDVDVSDKDWKTIFTLTVKKGNYDKDISERYLNKRYIFEKIDDKWKIISIDSDMEIDLYNEAKLKELNRTKEFVLDNLKYNTFRGEEVQYPTTMEVY